MPVKNSAEQTQFNKAEQVATKMFNVADKVDGAKQPELHSAFYEAANEFANEGYDKGQRILEKVGTWNDEIRSVTTEANRFNNERNGGKPLAFADAKKVIGGYASRLETSGVRQDMESAIQIDSLVRGMDRPGQSGLEGIDDALKYVEGLLQTKASSEKPLTPDMKKDWEEKRALRDALYAEKQKRIEQQKQVQQAGERVSQDRTSTTRSLENLYANAGVPENTPSRQELLQRAGRMPPEELHFLNAEIRKIAAKFNASGDAKSLDAALADLVTKKFTKEEVKKANQVADKEELEQVRKKLFGTEKGDSKQGQVLDKIFGDPSVQRAFENNRDALQETPEKITNVALDVFKRLYPESKTLISRLNQLRDNFDRLVAESKKRRPDLAEDSHKRFAVKEIIKSLSGQERQMMEVLRKSKLGFKSENVLFDDNYMYTMPEKIMGQLLEYLKNKND